MDFSSMFLEIVKRKEQTTVGGTVTSNIGHFNTSEKGK